MELQQSRNFKPRKLTLPGIGSLPSSIPLIYPNNAKYDMAKNELSLDKSKTRSSLKVLPEAIKLLESIQKPVAVVSICGPCRTGKSYILSRMLGSADAFALGHTMDAKTFGIWIGTSVLEFDEFTMLLLDTEGIDSVDAEALTDASILVLSVLLSSCFIYNSIGVPRKGDLNSMMQFEMIARSIIEKPGEDGSTLSKHFPDFIWLLRDVMLQLPAAEDGKQLSPTDYIIQSVLKRGQGRNYESSTDKVAGAIITSFPSIKCVMIPYPGDKDVIQNIASRQQDLSPIFNKEVEAFVHHLCDHAKPKYGYEMGSLVTGPLLARMVAEYVKIVNKPGAIPCISDVWSATIESEYVRNMNQLLKEYDDEMGEIIRGRMPMEEGDKEEEDKKNPTTLLGIHRKICQQKTTTLIERVGRFTTSQKSIGDLTSKFENALVTFKEVLIDPNSGKQHFEKEIVGGSLKKYVDENYKMSQVFCRAVFERLYDPIRKRTELKVDEESQYTFEQLLQDLQTLYTEYHKKAVGPARWEVYEEKTEYIEQKKRAFESFVGYQKKMFEGAQRVAEAEAKNHKFNETIMLLEAQINQQRETNEKQLSQLQNHHEAELDKMQKQIEAKMQTEKKHMEQMIQANVHETRTKLEEKLEFQCKEYQEEFQCMQQNYEQQMQQMQGKAEQELKDMESIKEMLVQQNDIFKSKPGPPQNIRSSSFRGATFLKMRWDPPSTNAQSVTHYKAQYRKAKHPKNPCHPKNPWHPKDPWHTFKKTEKQKLSAVARNLKSDTDYDFRVKSLNGNINKVDENGVYGEIIRMDTRWSMAAKVVVTPGAVVGGALLTPVVVAVAAAEKVWDAIHPQTKATKFLTGILSVGAGALGAVAGTIAAPVGSVAAAVALHDKGDHSPQSSDDES